MPQKTFHDLEQQTVPETFNHVSTVILTSYTAVAECAYIF